MAGETLILTASFSSFQQLRKTLARNVHPEYLDEGDKFNFLNLMMEILSRTA